MVRLLRENSITDLRNIINNIDFGARWENPICHDYGRGYDGRAAIRQNMNKKQALIDWFENVLRNDFDFNAEKMNLVKVDKPKSDIAAKRSNNILIGICSKTSYPFAVIVGNGEFYRYYSGDTGKDESGDSGLRGLMRDLDIWFEVVPMDDYVNRRTIQYSRATDARISISGMKNPIFDSEFELYDTDAARRKYANRLNSIRAKRSYDDILNSVEDINERIRSIDFGHPIFGGGFSAQRGQIENLRSTYNSLRSYLHYLAQASENDNEESIVLYTEWVKNSIQKINKQLTQDFKV